MDVQATAAHVLVAAAAMAYNVCNSANGATGNGGA